MVREEMGRASTLGEDAFDQALFALVPKAVALAIRLTPHGLRRSARWWKAQWFISMLFARVMPQGGGWDELDLARTEFFTQYRAALMEYAQNPHLSPCPFCKGAGKVEIN